MGNKPSSYDLQQDQRPLNEFTKPEGSIDLNNKRIINLATPIDINDGASKSYVDSVAQGLAWRPPVRLLDTVVSFRPTGLDVVIDGITVQAGNRVLFENLTMILENNRVYKAIGTGTNISGWGLETDGKAGNGDPTEGDTLLVKEGNTYADQGWTYSDSGWIQFTGTGQILAGQGLAKTSNEIYVGSGDGIAVTADAISLNLIALSGLALTGTSPTKALGINVDNSSLEITAGNVLQIKVDGVNETHWKPLTTVDNNNQIISNVLNPIIGQDVATKNYVDGQIGIENFWDRSGATILPHTANDSIVPNGIGSLGTIGNRFVSLFLSGDSKIGGDIEFDTNSVGIIFKSRTSDDRYRIYVDDNGVLSTELVV